MGMLWFNAFVLLSLLMRKLSYPIKFSIMPLAILLILSLVRVFVPIQVPSGAIHISSEVVFPLVISFLRYEIIASSMFGLSVNVLHILFFIWGAVSIALLTRYAFLYRKAFQLADLLEYAPDEEAETILAEITGPKVCGRVFRTQYKIPATCGFKPHIYLPKGVDFTQDELRAVLRHEWKHIRNKDYLVTCFMCFLCCIFWWNPLVYVLRRNVLFALEVRCDYFAVDTPKNLKYFTSALLRIYHMSPKESIIIGNALTSSNAENLDRFKLLALRFNSKTRKKRTLAYICFYLVSVVLFLSSYLFLILPATWASDFEHVDIERPIDCIYSEKAYRAEENFIVDNGDGTFSLYIDGQHMKDFNIYTDYFSQDIFTFFPIQTHEE